MSFKFNDPACNLEARVNDLAARLTLSEKCSQLRWNSPAIERLEIPAYNWWSEALHGIARNGKATVFPQVIGQAASFDRKLVEAVANAIADEGRAKHHEAVRQNSRQWYQGLTFWSPNVNLFRDPRWGRGQETFGEDPCLTGELGSAFVRGLQGKDPTYLKTAACAKHYAVHSGPEKDRHRFDARPSDKDLYESYLPAFERLVAEGVEAVMGAYNRVNGEPCCAHTLLMEDILRKEWNFQGHYVSDCWGIRDFHENHKVTQSVEESAALAINKGCDLNCGSVYCSAVEDAVMLGLCTEAEVDRSLKRLLRTRFKLGMFDPEEKVPYASIPSSVVNCREHRDLAMTAAERSIVLLKNRASLLPLLRPRGKLLVAGPHAASIDALLGNYHGLSASMSTLVEGLVSTAPEGLRISYRKATQIDGPNRNEVDWTLPEAGDANTIILALGIDNSIEGEEGDAILSDQQGDRSRIELPENQLTLFRSVADVVEGSETRKHLIVLLFGGSAIAAPEIQERSDAVLQVFYPGEKGGKAIARILFGKSHPSARLPFTVPCATADLPAYEEYSMQGRTYRYMDETRMLYPFGFGLNYGVPPTYETLESTLSGDTLTVDVTLSNPNPHPLREAVQIYIGPPENIENQPRFRLLDFGSVFLEANQSLTHSFSIPVEQLHYIDAQGHRQALTGRVSLYAAGTAPFKRSMELGGGQPVVQRLTFPL